MAYQIEVIVGSLRRASFNKQLGYALTKLASAEFSCEFGDIGLLPLYCQDYDPGFPEVARKFKQRIEAADGLLFVTPEYNRSMPGVLKNALDWGSRPWGSNSWKDKPAAVCGISVGAGGTALAQQHLRNVLAYLDVPTLGQPEIFLKHADGFFDASGSIASDDTRKFLQTFIDRFEMWVKRHAARN